MVRPLLPLTVEGAEVRRRGVRLVGPVELQLGAEGTTVIIGPNGAGKTTLLRMLHGLDRARGGRIAWAVPLAEARLRQTFVFQTPLMLRRTVLDNIAYPLQLRGQGRAAALARAEDWARRIGLGDALRRQAPDLSGGEKQKLALARALVTEPDLVFLDEPTAHLDGRATREIEEILLAARAAGTRLVMTTHDMGQARRLASEVIFLYRGRVHERGPAEAFFAGPATPEAAAFVKGDIVE